jgi:phosphatidylethanolamine/phosphatidyl-N-methylethanolamine N-methyltransferase
MAEAYGAAAKRGGPHSPMDADAVRDAYARYAGSYDNWFGLISAFARKAAVAAVNRAPGEAVLEVGVGTGLALPMYAAAKQVTGIDLSSAMLAQARARVAARGLRNIAGLLEMDAQATSFADGQFDIAVAMFVASVVPDPYALVAELKRIVRPGGTILFVNHFAAARGPVWWVERAMAPASAWLGWHPDFRVPHLLSAADAQRAKVTAMQPLHLFKLIELSN